MATPNQNQTVMIGKIAAASRFPDARDLRRDALMGGVVSGVNPLAGTILDVRIADKVSNLSAEAETLRAQNTALLDKIEKWKDVTDGTIKRLDENDYPKVSDLLKSMRSSFDEVSPK